MEPVMEDMADAAGSAAELAYTAALDGGATPVEAASAAMDAAAGIMTDMGAPSEMVSTMVSSASEGFSTAIDSGMDPMQAFDAAGDSVDAAMEAEYGPMGLPTGMESETPPPGTDGEITPPEAETDMVEGPEYGAATPPPEMGPETIGADASSPSMDMDGDGMPPPPPPEMGMEGSDPLFGEGAPSPDLAEDMPPSDPMIPDSGMSPSDLDGDGMPPPPPPEGMEGMEEMAATMDDAAAHAGPDIDPTAGVEEFPPADGGGDMPPPPADDTPDEVV